MAEYILGVDVSHHQDPKAVDYRKLKAAGVAWVMVRATYGIKADATMPAHVAKAREAGLDVGLYAFYRQSATVAQQVEAFDAAARGVDKLVTLAPALDLEWNDANDGAIKKDVFNSAGRVFAEALRRAHGQCVLYLAPGFYQQLGNPSWTLEYPWWIAHYTKEALPWCPFKAWDMWQYGVGRLDGFAGEIDVNRARALHRLPGAQVKPIEKAANAEERKALHNTLNETLSRLRELDGL